MHLRMIVAGSRTFSDQDRVDREIDAALGQIVMNSKEPLESIEFVSGGCRGADACGEAYANKRGYAARVMPADWEKYGRAAGPIRNDEMCEYAAQKRPFMLAFWDGKSAGTKSALALASQKGIETKIVYV